MNIVINVVGKNVLEFFTSIRINYIKFKWNAYSVSSVTNSGCLVLLD